MTCESGDLLQLLHAQHSSFQLYSYIHMKAYVCIANVWMHGRGMFEITYYFPINTTLNSTKIIFKFIAFLKCICIAKYTCVYVYMCDQGSFGFQYEYS